MSKDLQFGKRPPPTEISYDSMRRGDYEEKDVADKGDIGKQCSEEEIAARKILKIRRPGKYLDEATCMEATHNPGPSAKFSIGQALPTYTHPTNNNSQSQDNKQAPSFISNNTAKVSESSLFNNNNNNTKPAGGGLFGNPTTTATNMFGNAPAQQAPANLFSNNSSGGLFGNNSNNKSGSPGTGLNLFNNNTATNTLFQNNKSGGSKNLQGKAVDSESDSDEDRADTKPEPVKQQPSLFGNLAKPQKNLFADVESNNGAGLFSKGTSAAPKKSNEKEEVEVKPAGTGLFGNLNNPPAGGLFSGLIDASNNNNKGSTNIFLGNISTAFLKPQEQEDNEEDGDHDDENDQDEKEEEIDKSKSTGNYKYEENTTVLMSKEVSNFKVNEIPGYGKGKVSIEQVKNGDNMFLIFRNPAKLIKFQGLLVKKMSLCDYMRAKDDAIFIISYTVETKKDEAGNDKKSTVRNNSKMQFMSVEDSKELLEFVKKECPQN